MALDSSEGGGSTAEPWSAKNAASTEVAPNNCLIKHRSNSTKYESDTFDDNVKQESITPSSRAASTNLKEAIKSLFSGTSYFQGTLNPSTVRNTRVAGDMDLSYGETSSLRGGQAARRRPVVKTPQEFLARLSKDSVKNAAISNRNLKKTQSTKHKAKKSSSSSKASAEKLKKKLTSADSFSLDLGKEAPGFRARTQQEQFAHFLAACPEYNDIHKRGASKNALVTAARSFGRGNVRANDGKWGLRGMNTTLYNHQLIGASWMCRRECSSDDPRGGILGDAMGIGKTVECIAVIVSNPPDLKEVPREERTTLIVVPSGILSQWKKELKKHAGNTIKKIDVYKAREERDASLYTSADVVLTTYKQVAKSLPWPDKETLLILKMRGKGKKQFIEDAESSHVESYIRDNWDTAGVLHQIKWRRVLVDEGTSLALNAVKSDCRWIMTGTPFMNRLQDFYSYFRFLKDPEITTLSSFSAAFCNFDNKECNTRMDKKLSKLMIRRTMEDRILGQPLIWLPPAHHKVMIIELNVAEKILYKAVEGKFEELREQHFADRDPRKSMSHPFAQITHLRQLTSHPALVERKIMVLFNENELKQIREQIQGLDPVLYERMGAWIRGERAKVAAEYNLSSEEEAKICELCHEDPEDLIELPGCKHLFCDFCLHDKPEIELSEDGTEVHKCRACYEPYHSSELEKANEKREKIPQAANRKGLKGKDFRKYIPTTQKSVWLDQYDRGKIQLRPGSKLEAVMEQVQEWLESAPHEKIIIYTQWKMVSTIIGRMLEKENIDFLYYTGDMSRTTRDKTIGLFEKNPSIKILVSGLKCGGLGLNLTVANKVTSVELWWNPWAEKQAFGRVHRIGQVEETTFSRVVVKGTIEDRLAKLQRKKLHINNITMQDKLTKEDAETLLKPTGTERTLDLDAVDCNGDSIYALVGTDPGSNLNTNIPKKYLEEASGSLTEEESSEDESMEDIDDEIDDEGDECESDDSAFSNSLNHEFQQATVETEGEDND
ncbi:hypothetical protein BTUL_0150g00110 [Botrytis tulipae]|uniref:RING-type domain-containing protein n=1 Tax=Botrytis tulipae TaxID=87230 RepID=A0A4Z1ELS7_9HELO|nr:hypothetical protein BTUL_0150g00110 [Botrytis tulipae]